MVINMEWIKEEWATDLMRDIAKDFFAPKPKEQAVVSPQLAGSISYADWIIPVSAIGVVAVILLFIFVLK